MCDKERRKKEVCPFLLLEGSVPVPPLPWGPRTPYQPTWELTLPLLLHQPNQKKKRIEWIKLVKIHKSNLRKPGTSFQMVSPSGIMWDIITQEGCVTTYAKYCKLGNLAEEILLRKSCWDLSVQGFYFRGQSYKRVAPVWLPSVI